VGKEMVLLAHQLQGQCGQGNGVASLPIARSVWASKWCCYLTNCKVGVGKESV